MRHYQNVLAVAVLLAPLAARAEDQKPAPFEFHAYARLGTIGGANPLEPTREEQGQFGLYTSRHARDLNYVRVQTIGNFGDGLKFNLEAQLDGDLPHQKNNWDGAKVNLRNAYLEIPVAETDKSAKLWFGARRLEFEDVRLFDQTGILGETTFYGVGADYSVAGMGSVTAVGYKDVSASIGEKGEAGYLAAPARDTTVFQRFDMKLSDNAALRPTVIYYHNSAAKTEVTVNNKTTTQTVRDSSDNFKVGAVLSTWGDAGWNNSFVWLKSEGGSSKNYTVGLATSGDFEGLKESANLGIMYGAIGEYKMFNKDQQQFKLENDAIVADGTKKEKSNYVLALGVQPVYYVTDHVHGALDLNYSLQGKVGNNAPNVLLVTPIVRYAAQKSAMGTPQVFASVTYGKYEAKVKKDVKGKAVDTLVTSQLGMELWF